MGLCFVTEGAISYAASDPLHVIPSCAIGAATAGALSMAFHCGLRAPHGGIFVFPVVTNAPMYCVALAVGSILGGLILSLLKRTCPKSNPLNPDFLNFNFLPRWGAALPPLPGLFASCAYKSKIRPKIFGNTA